MPSETLSVWLDDPRPPPDDGSTSVRTPAEAIARLKVATLSASHSTTTLGMFEGDQEISGNAVILWLEEAVAVRGFEPPTSITVHSANPPAHEKMQHGIDAIYRLAVKSRKGS